MTAHPMDPAATGADRTGAGPSDVETDVTAVDRTLRLAFAPVHKMAFGLAVGVTTGLTLFLVTAVRLLVGPDGVTELVLLSQFLAGYEESWAGAVVGLAWGIVVGFVAGWFAAFVRNLVLASYLFVVRTRAELLATRDFLDHI